MNLRSLINPSDISIQCAFSVQRKKGIDCMIDIQFTKSQLQSLLRFFKTKSIDLGYS